MAKRRRQTSQPSLAAWIEATIKLPDYVAEPGPLTLAPEAIAAVRC